MTSEHRDFHASKFVHNIRLWGADGQRRLEQTHLLVLGCTATACQMVKSLVLPGASTFTLVDGRERADAATLQSNFFAYDDECVGLDELTVAERCCKGLSLLHLPSQHTAGVKGHSITQCPNTFIESGDFASYVQAKRVTFVIMTQMVSRANMAAAAKVLEAEGVMSTVLTVSGLVGAARLHSVVPIFIVETRSDMKFVDLRVWNPFPSLLRWFEEHDPAPLVGTSALQYVPWMCLVFHALRKWRADTGVESPTALPANMAQWAPVKATITNWFNEKSENCEEALAECKGPLDLRKARLTSTDKAVAVARKLVDNKAVPKGCVVPFILIGLQAFRDAHDNSIPLRSNKLVDFHTDTASYVCLSDVYKAQAALEAAEVHRYAIEALTSYGWSQDQLPFADVAAVCNNTPWDMGAVEWAPLAAELEAPPAGTEWYAALGSCHVYAGSGSFPGSQMDASLPELVASVQAASPAGLDTYIEEVVRGGGYEPISTACMLGSAAAEEAIKMIQERMVPAKDALVYDGHTQRVVTVTL